MFLVLLGIEAMVYSILDWKAIYLACLTFWLIFPLDSFSTLKGLIDIFIHLKHITSCHHKNLLSPLARLESAYFMWTRGAEDFWSVQVVYDNCVTIQLIYLLTPLYVPAYEHQTSRRHLAMVLFTKFILSKLKQFSAWIQYSHCESLFKLNLHQSKNYGSTLASSLL